MANFRFATPMRNDMGTAVVNFVGPNAKLLIYAGAQPAGGAAPQGDLLVTLLCGSVAFAPTPSGGVITLNSITSGVAGNSGTAQWARLTKSDDTWCLDGDVSVTGGIGDFKLDNVVIQVGATVSAPGTQTLTMPHAA